jgi:hypothetical protein
MAESLAARFPKSKALVIGNPFTQRPGQSAEIYAFERASVRGLQEGFGSPDLVKVVYPDLHPEFLKNPESALIDPKTTTPLSFLVAEDSFDRLVKGNPGFELVISLIGLPVRIREAEVWQTGSKTRFGLLLPDWRIIGSTADVLEAIRSGKIAAAVLSRPGVVAETESAAGDNYRAEFDRLYLLVTPDNVDELAKAHPQLF